MASQQNARLAASAAVTLWRYALESGGLQAQSLLLLPAAGVPVRGLATKRGSAVEPWQPAQSRCTHSSAASCAREGSRGGSGGAWPRQQQRRRPQDDRRGTAAGVPLSRDPPRRPDTPLPTLHACPTLELQTQHLQAGSEGAGTVVHVPVHLPGQHHGVLLCGGGCVGEGTTWKELGVALGAMLEAAPSSAADVAAVQRAASCCAWPPRAAAPGSDQISATATSPCRPRNRAPPRLG